MLLLIVFQDFTNSVLFIIYCLAKAKKNDNFHNIFNNNMITKI